MTFATYVSLSKIFRSCCLTLAVAAGVGIAAQARQSSLTLEQQASVEDVRRCAQISEQAAQQGLLRLGGKSTLPSQIGGTQAVPAPDMRVRSDRSTSTGLVGESSDLPAYRSNQRRSACLYSSKDRFDWVLNGHGLQLFCPQDSKASYRAPSQNPEIRFYSGEEITAQPPGGSDEAGVDVVGSIVDMTTSRMEWLYLGEKTWASISLPEGSRFDDAKAKTFTVQVKDGVQCETLLGPSSFQGPHAFTLTCIYGGKQ